VSPLRINRFPSLSLLLLVLKRALAPRLRPSCTRCFFVLISFPGVFLGPRRLELPRRHPSVVDLRRLFPVSPVRLSHMGVFLLDIFSSSDRRPFFSCHGDENLGPQFLLHRSFSPSNSSSAICLDAGGFPGQKRVLSVFLRTRTMNQLSEARLLFSRQLFTQSFPVSLFGVPAKILPRLASQSLGEGPKARIQFFSCVRLRSKLRDSL